MDDTLLPLLACPRDHLRLRRSTGDWLECDAGHRYPVLDGVPVLLRDDVAATLAAQDASLKRAQGQTAGDPRARELYLETVGITDEQRDAAVELFRLGNSAIDPVVQFLVAATCGLAYRQLVGKLDAYPIPECPLPASKGEFLIDLGCNWGRWSIAAARKGYRVIGIDPQLGALMAARRVARQLGLDIRYVCGDARYLPFQQECADKVFSYSVLQHFSREDCASALREVGRVLKGGGRSVIQMANALGVRSAYHLLQRRFGVPRGFSVRYYLPSELLALFEENVGGSRLTADCFLGLGLQVTDRNLVTRPARAAISVSETLKKLTSIFPPLRKLADSVYIESKKA